MELSSFCLARGRYEIAQELHAIGTEWYQREVVNRRDPHDSTHDRRQHRELLAEYKARLAELPLLVVTRSRLINSLRSHPQGIDRNKLKDEVSCEGSTAFGVICNQLARGGWIRQERDGKKFMLYPEKEPPASDDLFIEAELPTPEPLDRMAHDERPIATLTVRTQPAKQAGCLPSMLGLTMLGPCILWLSYLKIRGG
jgi:hypothetical protein